MGVKLTFLRMLGLDFDESSPLAIGLAIDAAAAMWPRDAIHPFIGLPLADPGPYHDIVEHLQSVLTFTSLRPGASAVGGEVGFWAEVHVANLSPATRLPLVAATMSKIPFYLLATDDKPAHVFVTASSNGVEIAVTGLPVEIQLPAGLVAPLDAEVVEAHLTDTWPSPLSMPLDGLEITARRDDRSSIKVRVNARLTAAGDVLVEPVVPISFGPARISGIPARGVHDLQLFTTLTPGSLQDDAHIEAAVPPDDALRSALPLTWTRHAVAPIAARNLEQSAIAVRTIDIDPAWGPARWLVERGLGDPDQDATNLELFIEDAMVGLGLPIPLHGRFGFRRRLEAADIGGDAYNLETTPVRLAVGGGELHIFRLLLQTTDLSSEAPFAADIAWVDEPVDPVHPRITGQRGATTLSVTETGDLVIGRVIASEKRPEIFQIAGYQARLAGLRIGAAVQKLLTEGAGSGADRLIWLVDVELAEIGKNPVFEVKPKSGPATSPDFMFRDVGWNAGSLSVGTLYDPDGADWLLAGHWKLTVREVGLVTTSSGELAVVFSGSVGNLGGAPPPTYRSDGSLEHGLAVSVQRLRIPLKHKLHVTMDGLGIDAAFGPVFLHGFGMLSHREAGNLRITEFGFDAEVGYERGDMEYRLGLLAWVGKAEPIDGTGDSFWFALGRLTIPYVPIANWAVLHDIRLLGAYNLAPALPPPSGSPQPMRVYRWYKDGGDVLAVPLDRQLARWAPEDSTWSAGLAATATLAATDKFRLSIFVLVYKPSDHQYGFLAGGELFFETADEPLAEVVVEYDPDSGFAILAGLDLTVNKIWPKAPSVLSNLGRLAGQLFWSGRLNTLAVGFFDDPATWLGFHLGFALSSRVQLEISAAACYHRVNRPDPGDPQLETMNVKAAALAGHLKIRVFSWLELEIYLTIDITWGQWRNEALASGVTLVAELGIRARVRWLSLTLLAHADVSWLGPDDNEYKRATTIIRLETPWFLPDVSLRWEKIFGTPHSARMGMISPPMSSAAAIAPGVARTSVPIGVTALSGIDGPTASLEQLSQASALEPADWDALASISPDSIIALDFAASMDALASLVPPSPSGAGQQTSGELAIRYELVEIGVRRRPVGAAAWSDLVDPATTRVTDGQGGVLEAVYQSELGFEWDADVTRIGRVDPRRLLVNASTPYSLTAGDATTDEDIATWQPRWPCCDGRPKPTPHVVDFADTPIGRRTPRWERFSASDGTLRWTSDRPPVVAMAAIAPAGRHVARFDLAVHPALVWRASFLELAASCDVELYFAAQLIAGDIALTGYRGLSPVVERIVPIASGNTVSIRLSLADGFDSVTMRRRGGPLSKPLVAELAGVRYFSRDELVGLEVRDRRCSATDDRIAAGKGRLAFLPHHDYQVSARVRVVLEHEGVGTQSTEVEQRAYFRTRGLPGLGWTARAGEEIESYLASRYPAEGALLYRREPIALAFTEGFNVVVPVDRSPADQTPERQQLVEWTLAVEHAAVTDCNPVTETDEDWLSANAGGLGPVRWPHVLDADGLVMALARTAPSADPYRARQDRMLARPGGCGHGGRPPPPSQVLLHPARDPGAADRWRAATGYRVSMRRKRGPYARRDWFAIQDLGAFSWMSAGGFAAPWRVDADAMVADAAALQIAAFGAPTWDHVAISADVDPGEGEAGVAVAVGPGPVAILGLIGGAPRQVRLVAVAGATIEELATAALPDSAATGVVTITATAWDDRFTVAVGEVLLAAPRTPMSLHGSGRVGVVARGGAAVRRLLVRGIDAFRMSVETSRYDTFAQHLATWSGTAAILDPVMLGQPARSVAELLAATATAMESAMLPGSPSPARDQLFRQWVEELRLPLVTDPDRVLVSRYVDGDVTVAFLIESSEPVPFAGDVSLTLERPQPPDPDPPWPPWPPWPPRPPRPPVWPDRRRRVMFGPYQPVAVRILSSGDQRAALVIPVDGSGAAIGVTGELRLTLTLERRRYASAGPDANAVYHDSATLQIV